jgi:hypothetical protein
MTQTELDRQVAELTGERVDTIRQRGFSLVEVPDDQPPRIVDWDALDAQRIGFLPPRPRLAA